MIDIVIPTQPTRLPQRGFTLIELLVVIGILGVLAVALLPAIGNAISGGDEAETQTRMLAVDAMIAKFEREYGFYPSDDFTTMGTEVKLEAKADQVNAGIESLVMTLCAGGEAGITDNEAWLANTDGDENSATIPLLDRKAKVEIVDAWGNPLAYFHNRNYSKAQTVLSSGGSPLQAQALKNPNSSGYLAPRKYQLHSAGADGEFGTADDVTLPEVTN